MAGGERHEGARDVSDFALVVAVLSSLRAKHTHSIKITLTWKCLKRKQNIRFIPTVPQIQAARVSWRTCMHVRVMHVDVWSLTHTHPTICVLTAL